MQNVILLAVVCVGFFYALYRVYKNSDGTEGSSGTSTGSGSSTGSSSVRRWTDCRSSDAR